MKKKIKPLQKTYKSIKIYRDDLIQLESLFINRLHSKDFKIIHNDFECDSINEIPKNTHATHVLSLISSNPYVRIEFGEMNTSFYLPNDSLTMKGAFNEINSIIGRRRQIFLYILSKFGFLASGLCFWSFMTAFLDSGSSLIRASYLLLAVISAIWVAFSFKYDLDANSTVVFTDKSENPNFLRRNKDQILLGVLFASFGAILGYLFAQIK